MSIVKKVFFEVNLFNYAIENDVVKKKPIAFLIVETNDPDTRIMPMGANPEGEYISIHAEIIKKDQRNMHNSGE